MLQIIGKGGMGREVQGYAFQTCKLVETNEPINTELTTVIGVGSCEGRKKIFGEFPNLNYICLFRGEEFGDNTYGKGTIVAPGTIVTCNVSIGNHVIVNLNCTIHHDVKIGDFSTISPGVNVCGNVEIGDSCFIGANSVIKEKVKICSNTTIGAGSVVIKDITESGTYVGNPVRRIK